ncbi:galactose-binding domain-like protein [Macrophomina phaseolina]|uniref:Galactose-binding domain-like protein n=1 Tax=Macrophomina phaseolina TaxID=35725 RepID=A0ABQ8GWK2_9PEZI|nr:galactose-binding domain-like protein [Macrophomina phaseolina]
MHAGSDLKYLRFIVGRHDLPFYYPEEVEVQRSFLDAFLKDEDREGWTQKGTVPPVDLVVRKGDVGHNNPAGEKQYPRRKENEWPIARTRYTELYLTPSHELLFTRPVHPHPSKLGYRALGTVASPHLVAFATPPFDSETEITGHIVAHLNVSASGDRNSIPPSDIDLFVTIRHLSATGKEILYTGSTGDGVPVTQGWLRHPRHQPWLPHRNYLSSDVLPVLPNEVYPVDIELWPTSVVIEKGESLVFQVSSGDTEGASVFLHDSPDDRQEIIFKGTNFVHFGPPYSNYVTIPIIP